MVFFAVFVIIVVLTCGLLAYFLASEDIKRFVFPACVKCKHSESIHNILMCNKVVDDVYGYPSHCSESRGCYKCRFAKAKDNKNHEESEM